MSEIEVSDEVVQKIQHFAQNRQEADKANEPLSATALHAYTRRLDGTLRDLQEQVRRQEDELKKLREVRSHGLLDNQDDPWARISHARRARKAYDSLLQTDNDLPATDSVLPSLIAIEETSQLITNGKTSVSLTAEKLSTDRERLRVEGSTLHDSRLIATGLRERIERIRKTNVRKQEQTPSQVAREMISQQKKKNKELDRSSADLKVALDKFIDETLAPMLAAEDLGGPAVGDALDVSDATLQAGYTAHGKPKKPKHTTDGDGNQQRIDRFVQRSGDDSTSTNKRETTATEVHDLLNALLDAGTSYVNLQRDSAASRFLVKAKVAQFHPRDARRLRLIDFGRSLSD